jgi:signal transduction histidine kinase
MSTIRSRLAWSFAVAATLTVAVFSIALFFQLRMPDPGDLQHRVRVEAEYAVRWLESSHQVLGALVIAGEPPTLDPGTSAYLEGSRDLLVVASPEGDVLFLSPAARELGYDALQRLSDPLTPPPPSPVEGVVDLGGSIGDARYIVLPVHNAGSAIGGVLAAAEVGTPAPLFDAGSFVRAMLVVSPLILLAALGIGYYLAGRALAPVEGIMDEVEAITDGRSLHRRLAVPMTADEVARLASTLNRMLARLEQSFSSLHRFTADASHELKTPLMVLRAGVERALTDPRTPPEVLQTLDETLEQINWMTEMVESLLTLARADEGRAPLTLEESDLRPVIADVAETAEMLGEQHGVEVRSEVPETPVTLPVDPHRIREMLLNLVTNAIKYTPSGGSVELALREQDGNVALLVRDTGIGIAPGDLPHIFDRFWRADPARSRTGDRPGVGLGLAITKWIAEAHGGVINVQSRPGRGTAFTVVLPRTGTLVPPRRTSTPVPGVSNS